MNLLRRWVRDRFPVESYWRSIIGAYQVPRSLNIGYVFGALLLFILLNQVVSGFWLMMFYTPSVTEAFESIQSLMREVSYGWLFRYLHTTGASSLFILLYLHLFRNLLYGSYQKPRELVWLLGMALWMLLMFESFLGYTLPWGQMSYWGAQVFTSALGSLPWIGPFLMQIFRGDFVLSDISLHRFYAIHVFAIPLLIGFLVYLHLIALRHVGSSTPVKQEKKVIKIPFYPFFMLKDGLALCVFLVGFALVLFYDSNGAGYLIDPLNSIPADPLQTPEKIHPAWYLSPFYSMIRLVSNKSLGLFVVVLSLLVAWFLPWVDRQPYRLWSERPRIQKISFLMSLLGFVVLGILGMMEWTPFVLWVARGCWLFYIFYFMLLWISDARS